MGINYGKEDLKDLLQKLMASSSQGEAYKIAWIFADKTSLKRIFVDLLTLKDGMFIELLKDPLFKIKYPIKKEDEPTLGRDGLAEFTLEHMVVFGLLLPVERVPLYMNSSCTMLKVVLRFRLELGR